MKKEREATTSGIFGSEAGGGGNTPHPETVRQGLLPLVSQIRPHLVGSEEPLKRPIGLLEITPATAHAAPRISTPEAEEAEPFAVPKPTPLPKAPIPQPLGAIRERPATPVHMATSPPESLTFEAPAASPSSPAPAAIALGKVSPASRITLDENAPLGLMRQSPFAKLAIQAPPSRGTYIRAYLGGIAFARIALWTVVALCIAVIVGTYLLTR
jgi:hypothetical protein